MMVRFGLPGLIAAVLLMLAACEKPPENRPDGERKQPVVVYAAFEDDAHLQDPLAQFTEETGVLVIVRRGDSQDIVTDLIENRVFPPADVLMTNSVVDIWRAAEEGALRPIAADTVAELSPGWSRDPDGLWAGIGVRSAVIVYDAAAVGVDGSLDYASLQQPHFRGKLCLSSSSNAVNRTVIAMLIDELDIRPAELAVRGWMKNLAMPVFDSEYQVVEAIESGACAVGIVSSSVAVTSGLSVHAPSPTFADVDGIGIGRHARNPDGAMALLKWLFDELPETEFDTIDQFGRQNVSLVAWYQEDAIKLAERAHYR
jgi:iron(III) transport system substrate-binding protein